MMLARLTEHGSGLSQWVFLHHHQREGFSCVLLVPLYGASNLGAPLLTQENGMKHLAWHYQRSDAT